MHAMHSAVSHKTAAISGGSVILKVLSVPDRSPAFPQEGWDSEGSEPNPRHQIAASSVYKPEVRSGEAFAAILRKTYKLHHSAKVQMQHRLHPDGWSKCLRRRAASE